MNLDQELDRLYQLPLAEFVAGRNELAKRLRSEGDREAADRVKKLAKPSLTAWAVNQLHFQARPSFDDLLAAGEKMKAAIAEGARAHQAATKARREAIAELLAIAGEILDAAGQKLSRVHRQRLSRTLEAVAGGAEWTPGRLDRDLEPPGFDALASLAASLGRPPSRPAEPEPEPAEEPVDEPAEVVDLAAARKARQEKLDQARRDVEAAAQKLAERERAAAKAGAALKDAERLEGEAGTAVDEAERRLREARQRLEAATDAAARSRREAELESTRRLKAGERLAEAEEVLRRIESSTG